MLFSCRHDRQLISDAPSASIVMKLFGLRCWPTHGVYRATDYRTTKQNNSLLHGAWQNSVSRRRLWTKARRGSCNQVMFVGNHRPQQQKKTLPRAPESPQSSFDHLCGSCPHGLAKCKGPLRVQQKSRFWKFPKSFKKYCIRSGDLN